MGEQQVFVKTRLGFAGAGRDVHGQGCARHLGAYGAIVPAKGQRYQARPGGHQGQVELTRQAVTKV